MGSPPRLDEGNVKLQFGGQSMHDAESVVFVMLAPSGTEITSAELCRIQEPSTPRSYHGPDAFKRSPFVSQS